MLRTVNFKGKSLHLVGRRTSQGDRAPDFRVTSSDLKEANLADFKNKTKVMTTFPSLDTPVCDLQVREFNKRAAGLSDKVAVLAISKDLPFAQKRFCQSNNINNMTVLSDYKYSSYGINYGLLIKELNLLARAVVIADNNNLVRYIQIAEELTKPPDYDDVIMHINEVLQNPSTELKEKILSHCQPCEVGAPALSKQRISELLVQIQGWELIDGGKLKKEFKFKDFLDAKYFFDLIANLAQEQGHHPTLTLSYNKLRVTLTTHAAEGLTDNDFIMARIIDEL